MYKHEPEGTSLHLGMVMLFSLHHRDAASRVQCLIVSPAFKETGHVSSACACPSDARALYGILPCEGTESSAQELYPVEHTLHCDQVLLHPSTPTPPEQ